MVRVLKISSAIELLFVVMLIGVAPTTAQIQVPTTHCFLNNDPALGIPALPAGLNPVVGTPGIDSFSPTASDPRLRTTSGADLIIAMTSSVGERVLMK
jgi:hypothetical protein